MKDLPWWKTGVIYQIYPRSFKDTNNDGIGDISGIIEKLDYIQSLGVDAVWISPVNLSPMADFGYDVSDYRKIDPVFGSDQDMDDLIVQCHKKGLKILMDLVVNHSSVEHPWFKESQSSRNNPKADWYIWKDPVKGKVPNKWLSIFGGKAWEWNETRKQYYLHTFLKEQPDLNWRNPEVQKAVFDEMRYWLSKGVDGFRLDAVSFFVKDDLLRNNPFEIGATIRPYDWQKHIYDTHRPEIHDLMKKMRKVTNEYKDRMMVGEVISRSKASAEYLGDGENQLHLAFDFALLRRKWNAADMFECVREQNALLPEKGWPCLVLNNHDKSRSISRYGKKYQEARARLLAVFLLTLKGTPFLYAGEEIGMKDGKIKRKELVDPVGVRYWPFNPGRDPERTPMQWNTDKYAGFSTVKPWLPVNKEAIQENVELQEKKLSSMLSFYKKILKLRKEYESLNRGDWNPIFDGKNGIIAYERRTEKENTIIILNFTHKTRKLHLFLPYQAHVLLSTHREPGALWEENPLSLEPFEATILLRV